jgi:hypothetical protein
MNTKLDGSTTPRVLKYEHWAGRFNTHWTGRFNTKLDGSTPTELGGSTPQVLKYEHWAPSCGSSNFLDAWVGVFTLGCFHVLLFHNREAMFGSYSCNNNKTFLLISWRPRLWCSGQSSWLQIQKSGFDSRALPDFLRSGRSGTGSTQPREYNWGATWKK